MQGEPPVVLLVEDNDDHAELVYRALEEHKIKTRLYRTKDGEAALDFLFRRGKYADIESSPVPRVVLLDLRLPKVDGLEVLWQINTTPELQNIPVVVLTTSESLKDVNTAYLQRANSYVVKPVEFGSFSKLIRDLGSYWLSWNRIPRNGSGSDET